LLPPLANLWTASAVGFRAERRIGTKVSLAVSVRR